MVARGLRIFGLALFALLVFPRGTPGANAFAVQETCPWCENDPAKLEALGALSHGPFPLAHTTSDEIRADLPASQWVFLETPHMRMGSSLLPVKLSVKERKRLQPEFEALRERLPDFPKKVKVLDPWLRLHLMALRLEKFYARFQGILGVTDADFPETRMNETRYMGAGRYLGEKDKFEFVWHANRGTHLQLTKAATGINVTDALRWHFSPQHKMFASIPAEDADLKGDRWLLPHSVNIASHLFLCAYKDFAYDPPIWLDAGLAHCMEREIEPTSTTIDGDEGSGPARGGQRDWRGKDERLAGSKKETPFAAMMRWSSFHDLDEEANIQAWSRVRFLLEEHPKKLAAFIGDVKGQLDERRMPTGSDLISLQRKKLNEHFGWTPNTFDDAWRAWVRGELEDQPK